MKNIIEKKLATEFNPEFLEVKNNSYLHQGHAGDDGSGNTHFSIIIEAQDLKNISKVSAHRKINKLLSAEFKNGLHALEIKVK